MVTERSARLASYLPRTRGTEWSMDPNWNDNQPIYRQLRDRMVALILEGALKEGDPLPSVRAVAADYRLNPLTVLKGYQQLVDERLVEKRPRTRHVRERRGPPASAGRRARTLLERGMATHPGDHPPIGLLVTRAVRADSRRHSPRSAAARRLTYGRMSSPMPALIDAQKLTKRYGKHTALDQVSFTVDTGRIVGLIGPNGAGQDQRAAGHSRAEFL